MKERPILFSGEMVRAILVGRKTQTRRVVKDPENFGCLTGDCPHEKQLECDQAIACFAVESCPYGSVGDRLWVKETHGINRTCPMVDDLSCVGRGWIHYAADDSGCPRTLVDKLRPSIFMFRNWSRITLEIVSVRVERLQQITDADARAEGCCGVTSTCFGVPNYRYVWESINGAGSWKLNPWVWVIEFKKL